MTYTFTPDQALHAQQVAMKLWRKRFFLPSRTDCYPLPYLPEVTFEHLYKQNRKLKDLYESVSRNTQNHLLEEEHAMWLEPLPLNERQKIASCNLYGSGLDIVAIVPLQELFTDLPHNESELADELLDLHYPTTRRDDITPSLIREKRQAFKSYADMVFQDNYKLVKEGNATDKSIVVLETRFEPVSSSLFEDDFMKGKLDGLITYPYLSSYVVHKHALTGTRFSEKAFTIFTSLKSGHIAIEYDDSAPILRPDQKSAYDCKVSFATIL